MLEIVVSLTVVTCVGFVKSGGNEFLQLICQLVCACNHPKINIKYRHSLT